MLPEYFAVVGAIVASLGGLYYFYETLTGRSQPNRITWLLWGLFPMITFAAQRAQGVEGLSWVSLASGLTPLLVVAASFVNKKAYWKTERRDYYIMAAAFVGIILWAVTKNPNLAIAFAILADLLAGLPTVLKAYKHPQTESWPAFAISTLGFGIAILSIQAYTFENYAFVAYLFLMNGLIMFLARRPAQA